MANPKRKKLRPPDPIGATSPTRSVEVPPTVGKQDTTAGDQIRVSKTRADWRANEFTKAIRQHGKFIWWRKALLCPCGTAETDQAELDCQDCNGSGYVYVHPLCIQAHMAQFDKKTNIYDKIGLYQSGAVMITSEPHHRFGYRDSLELRDDVMSMNELLDKGNRRGRRTQLPSGVDSARFRIVSIAAILHKTSAGALISLEEGVHYGITPEGWIRWTNTGNRALKDGSRFSVHYDYHPIFYVESWMHITRNDTSGRASKPGTPRVVSHPVQAMAKLAFLVDANAVPSLDDPGQPSGIGPGELDDA
jgi:hypothetical protein